MDPNQLLNRLKNRDMEAYHHLTEKYGWKLYSYLKTRFQDKAKVDEALNETLHRFYSTIAGSDDAIEALLISFAERTCQDMMGGNKRSVPEKKSSGKIGRILFIIAISILIFCIFVALWIIVGLLMDLGIMPEVDLGYSWFSANIFPWF